VRRFRCSGSAGEFSARVTPLPAEHGGLQLRLSATDVVGNEATAAACIRLR